MCRSYSESFSKSRNFNQRRHQGINIELCRRIDKQAGLHPPKKDFLKVEGIENIPEIADLLIECKTLSARDGKTGWKRTSLECAKFSLKKLMHKVEMN